MRHKVAQASALPASEDSRSSGPSSSVELPR